MVWAGTLDEFFEKQLSAFQRSAIGAACVDMHRPYRLSLEQWVPQCRLIYDKFHVMQHANDAVSEVRRAEFFRKGGAARELIKGKHWLLLTRWVHLNTNKKRQLNELFALNRRVMKAYLLKESLDRLWDYRYDMKEPCCAIYKAGLISCAGSGSSPWRSWPRCYSIIWKES
jgi:transposase